MNRSTSSLLVVLVASSVGACSSAEGLAEDPTFLETLAQKPDAAPPRSFIANVTAMGNGCPDGSTLVNISDDGQTFTLFFSQYEASVKPGKASKQNKCNIVVDLEAGKNTTFAVTSLFYSGFVFLDRAGMTAQQSADYSFKGPIDATRNDLSTLSGPIEREFLYQDDVAPPVGRKAKCVKKGKLHVHSEIQINNDPTLQGSGYINTVAVDGNVEGRPTLRFRIATEPCP